jgi:integrase
MATLVKIYKKIPLQKGAIVKGKQVFWTSKQKKRTGKLTPDGKVSHQIDVWTAQFTDENGKTKRISTKTTNKIAAEKILAKYVAEVDQIKAGILTRKNLALAKAKKLSIEDALEKFKTKMSASGVTAGHVKKTIGHIITFCGETSIETLPSLKRDIAEQWIADNLQTKERSARTINSYIVSLKSFTKYLAEIEIIPKNPLTGIKKLNQEVDRRLIRRALTENEIERLLAVAKQRSAEHHLIYRLFLGTGLRSTELSLLVPSQVNFAKCRLTIEAAKTKNKKPDILPLRPNLTTDLKKWIDTKGTKPNERIFHFNVDSIFDIFCRDLKVAGIERIGSDGRTIDVHSLRKTFGTRLATAGVPLTTVQRLMRHSTPDLTAKLYIDVEPLKMAEALEKLPED